MPNSLQIQVVKCSKMLAGLIDETTWICDLDLRPGPKPRENAEIDPNSGCEMLGNAGRAKEFGDPDSTWISDLDFSDLDFRPEFWIERRVFIGY